MILNRAQLVNDRPRPVNRKNKWSWRLKLSCLSDEGASLDPDSYRD